MMHITLFNPSLDLVKAEIGQSKNIKSKATRKAVGSILQSVLN